MVHWFNGSTSSHGVLLPFDLEAVLRDWGALRMAMTKEVPPEFTRDEWAYLIGFLDPHALRGTFEQTFGAAAQGSDRGPTSGTRFLVRPRGMVAVWLPNNVSLLGPLTLVLLSLTGNRVELKAGTASENLVAPFLRFALAKLGNGALRAHLEERVRLHALERTDERVKALAAEAQVRIVFGSNAAAEAIHSWPHPLESVGFSFVDRRSEAWIDRASLNDALLTALVKVFAIYGQAGCTSPRKLVLIGGTHAQAVELRDRLVELWPQTVREVPMHLASANVMARQWAAALGWDTRLAGGHGAALGVPASPPPPSSGATEATVALPEIPEAPLFLPVVALHEADALRTLPANLQTLGVALTGGNDRLLQLASKSRARRIVPLARMHHFGPVWDGEAFWRQTFDVVELQGGAR
ncbi:MAG: hypothetical protein JST92_14185 [Deltaproteobacteria bacterium]|nr:hypothetical protein [Deltaproteobacteria bacterium]